MTDAPWTDSAGNRCAVNKSGDDWAIHRHMDLKKLEHCVNRVHGFRNIHQHLDLIAGLPYEDYDTFHQSFNDVYQMKPDQLQLGFLKVLKGSLMQKEAKCRNSL